MKRKKLVIGSILMGMTLSLSACGSSDNIVTTKSGSISESDFNKKLKENYGKQNLSEMVVEKVLNDKYKVTDEEVTKQLKELKDKMGDNFNTYMESNGVKNEDQLKEKLKLTFAFEKAIKATVTEKDIKDHYKPKLQVSHILVKDEKTAKEIKEKLNNGEDFAALAKQYSEDPGSKEKGGELPEFGSGEMDSKFEEAAYKLEAGQVSDPIKSSHGYHIIKLTEKKELKPFDQEKDNIRKELEQKRSQDQQWQQQFFKGLFKKADIKITDKDLKDTFKEFEK
ncbi:peptidylprolyl isomerase [Bacillus cereus]|uniref:peptidylprolyl isomerase n=1 Tax=Bacillus cereus TaxID=1396 RepID=UPI000BF2F10A|nr:peptidylprolyl isomerase [Bacillus cereus]PEY88520.1 peptidylprolyl isomerase [Bacillus cereus]